MKGGYKGLIKMVKKAGRKTRGESVSPSEDTPEDSAGGGDSDLDELIDDLVSPEAVYQCSNYKIPYMPSAITHVYNCSYMVTESEVSCNSGAKGIWHSEGLFFEEKQQKLRVAV